MTEGLIFDDSATEEALQGGSVAADRIRLLLHNATGAQGIPVRIPVMGFVADLTPLIHLDEQSAGKIVVSAPSSRMIVASTRLAAEHPDLGVTNAQAVMEAVILSWTIVTVDRQRIALYEQLGATAIDVTDT